LHSGFLICGRIVKPLAIMEYIIIKQVQPSATFALPFIWKRKTGLAARMFLQPIMFRELQGVNMDQLADQIIQAIETVKGQYHRLILLVAPAGAGKTAALLEVERRTGFPRINGNLELSRRLLDLGERQQPLQAARLLAEIVEETGAEVVLLDNMELLFDCSLRQDPLRLLQGLARNTTIVAAWNGIVERQRLYYAVPDHREHRSYLAQDLQLITPER